jgi:hypothetical protein
MTDRNERVDIERDDSFHDYYFLLIPIESLATA